MKESQIGNRQFSFDSYTVRGTMPDATYRILDANFNRAREALRVLEDYARFALDDDALCTELKRVRHTFAEITAPLAADAIAWRDTPGDVGTDNKTPAELRREDLPAVVV